MDKNKNLISPENLKQGNAYILHFTIKQKSALKLENLALAQILPSGWEIENERIDSNNRFRNNNVDYTDIRDDRIIWFFSTDNFLSGRQVLTIPFRAVTAGNFAIPPAIMEAMYSNDYTTITEGGKTIIEK